LRDLARLLFEPEAEQIQPRRRPGARLDGVERQRRYADERTRRQRGDTVAGQRAYDELRFGPRSSSFRS
jgi:hypothetical protein